MENILLIFIGSFTFVFVLFRIRSALRRYFANEKQRNAVCGGCSDNDCELKMKCSTLK